MKRMVDWSFTARRPDGVEQLVTFYAVERCEALRLARAWGRRMLPQRERYSEDRGQPHRPCARGGGMIAYRGTEHIAALLDFSIRTVHELTRNDAIPCRRLPGMRRILFDESEVAAWVDGAELEVIETPAGGKVVRPKAVGS